MAKSQSHTLGEFIGAFFEDLMKKPIREFAQMHGLYFDTNCPRKARGGKKTLEWTDVHGNKHRLDFVIEEMAYSIHRFIENTSLNGSGSVTGLSTLTNSLTAGSATAITADEVITLQGKVKDVFQGNAIWIMSPSTRDSLRLLKDEVGRYLLQDDITAPFGKTLLGKPIYVTDNMPEIGAGNTVIYYGDMKGLATKFSEDMNIQVLREKYATQHAIGVVGWLEFDSKVEDAQKIAKLVMAGTTPSI